ncbi:hypothetical protein DSO57_1023910 [Entomophthora muscae]|uniref:Uncharacterized protein n=1 Tax=Entomophthora muscae TaxID=34485 RepID=A0ACC2T2U5_9FUNG|nr:hypothetical protein DSO57_1023910 [Entomophthora muscae]
MPANLRVVPPASETKTLVISQCPGFYAEDTLILLQAIYPGLFWLGLIILLNPSISFGNFHKTVFEATLYTTLKEKGTVKFYYINESSFVSSMRNEYGYVPKGEKNSMSQCAAVQSVAYSMVALLGPLVLN